MLRVERAGARVDWRRDLRERWATAGSSQALVLLYGLLTLLIVFASLTTPTFLSITNITNILRQSILIGLVAIGQAVVVFAGAFDFSIGVTSLLSAITGGLTFGATGGDIPLGIAAALATGITIGLVNGLLVTKVYANPFITTFGMYFIIQGIIVAITTYPITTVPSSFVNFYSAQVGWLPWCVVAMAGVWVAAWFATRRTSFGRALFAVGGSRQVARLAGISVTRTLIGAYVVAGVFGALAGLFTLSQSGVADVQLNGLEFSSIVAIAVGGVSLRGGSGSLVGAFGGVMILQIASTLLNLRQVSEFYQQLVTGLIILGAVATLRQGEQP